MQIDDSLAGPPLAELLDQAQRTSARFPHIVDLLTQLPPWLRDLGTPEGVQRFEDRRRVLLPEPLRLYFAHPAVACWLQLYADTNTFMAEKNRFPDPPPLVCWSGQPCVVIGHFDATDDDIAVELRWAQPRVLWGCDQRGNAFALPQTLFANWLGGIVRSVIAGPK